MNKSNKMYPPAKCLANLHQKPLSEYKHFDVLGFEFNYKVRHDFRKYLFLSLKKEFMTLEEFFGSDFSYEGYEKHKVIKYHTNNGERVLHLYVKYKTCFDAMKSRDHYRTMNKYHAEIVDDVLKGWYSYEVMCRMPGETCGVLDIVGQAKFNNPITEEITSKILMPFGNPRIVQIQKDYVNVAFSSMAEAIAACIALGQWFFKSTPQDNKFYYRLLLNKSDRFTFLVNKCNQDSTALDAYNLDYFVPSEEKSGEKLKPQEPTYENAKSGCDYLQFDSKDKSVKQQNKYKPNIKQFRPRFNRYNIQNCNFANDGKAMNSMISQAPHQSPNLNRYCQNTYNPGCG